MQAVPPPSPPAHYWRRLPRWRLEWVLSLLFPWFQLDCWIFYPFCSFWDPRIPRNIFDNFRVFVLLLSGLVFHASSFPVVLVEVARNLNRYVFFPLWFVSPTLSLLVVCLLNLWFILVVWRCTSIRLLSVALTVAPHYLRPPITSSATLCFILWLYSVPFHACFSEF